MWRGSVPKAKHAAYVEYVTQTGQRESHEASGNRGAYVLTRDLGAEVEVMTMTFWDSLDSVKAYAGGDPTHVRYYPEDAKFLTVFTPLAEHFEVVAGPEDLAELKG